MALLKQYKLRNRDGLNLLLELTDNNLYILTGDYYSMRYSPMDRGNYPEEYKDDYDLELCTFIDPNGGPFISPGYTIDNAIVSMIISKDNKLYFKLSEKED